MENKHTLEELKQYQSLSLESKIHMTATRINGWIREYGEDGVYVSFSGGKDSTVLMDIVRNEMGYNLPAVFVDVPTQFPELKELATSWDNVEVIKPKISFMEVCERYGFPLISKEISESVHEARVSLSKGITDSYRLRQLTGQTKGHYDKSKWAFMMEAPFSVSQMCCNTMKKQPVKKYEKMTGRKGILATMACESDQRTSMWIKNGCNGFNMKRPISNPMSFWTEQDILQYIKSRNLKICSVYGDVVEDFEAEGLMDGQVTFKEFDGDKILKTTKWKRTGCMLCGFGCHMKDDDRFLQLKENYPKMYNLLDVVKNNGVTFREAIEWTNEHGNLNIRL